MRPALRAPGQAEGIKDYHQLQRRWVKQSLNYGDASTDSVTFDCFIRASRIYDAAPIFYFHGVHHSGSLRGRLRYLHVRFL
jgi:hypothetical protein